MKALGWIIRIWRQPYKGILTIDHIVPRARNGKHCIGNVQAIPRVVNLAKSDYLYDEMPDKAMERYLEYTGGLVCEPCKYDCSKCPFGDTLADQAMEYSAWVPEDKEKGLELTLDPV